MSPTSMPGRLDLLGHWLPICARQPIVFYLPLGLSTETMQANLHSAQLDTTEPSTNYIRPASPRRSKSPVKHAQWQHVGSVTDPTPPP